MPNITAHIQISIPPSPSSQLGWHFCNYIQGSYRKEKPRVRDRVTYSHSVDWTSAAWFLFLLKTKMNKILSNKRKKVKPQTGRLHFVRLGFCVFLQLTVVVEESQNHRITPVEKDVQNHPVQLFTYQQHFYTKPCPFLQHLNIF